MNGLDLFSGIGGISLALSEWVRPIAYCESEPYAQGVLLSRMRDASLPIAPIWDDVRTLRRHDFPPVPVDIVYGGFPCQDISVAGHGIGLAGKRSGLYWEMHRIIKEFKPTFVFIENVPAIRTRGAMEVAKSLAAIGYDPTWDIISAREVGASFIGDRWFLLAAADGETLRIEQGRRERASRTAETFNSSISDTRFTPWTPERGFESHVFGVGNGVPYSVDRDRALGNGAPPPQVKKAFVRLMGLGE